jgi:DNA gyrase/topoisomerase IV subunit A
MKISDFYNTDYADYASYDNLRKIASAIDGQKNTARKIVCTVMDKNINTELKVSQLSNKMAEHTEYLHGDASGVVVTMAQNFAGTNNVPLLDREGNFGTRFINDASAPRYIYTKGSQDLWNIFNKDDKEILEKQFFEGDEIEPIFYLPNLPMILINGSEGISSGFAQKILPRNPELIKKFLEVKLQDGHPSKGIITKAFTPYFKGFKGTVEQGDNPAQWLIKGAVQRTSIAKVLITELPIGYNLKSYIKVLDKLEDDNIITGYKDKSDNDIFEFEVGFLTMNLKKLSDDQLLNTLNLVKKVTENYTCMNAQNKIQIFDSAEDIFTYYFEVKMTYLTKRKTHLLSKMTSEIEFDASKYLFIKNIVDETLKINKRKKTDIEKDLVKIAGIITRDNSYDYLLNMSIQSLTTERMAKLLQDVKDKKVKFDVLQKISNEQMWRDEL